MVYALLDLWIICQGHSAARAHSPGRTYTRFATQLEAEEWATWWSYEHPLPLGLERTIVLKKEGA